MKAHWGIPDPADVVGTDEEIDAAFQKAYDRLQDRILAFVKLPIAQLDRAKLQNRLDGIGMLSD